MVPRGSGGVRSIVYFFGNRQHPKAIGDRTTLAVTALHSLGFLLLPFGENTRYDLVIDNGSELWRVQCKAGRLRYGSIRFKTCSSYAHHRDPTMQTRHYQGEIDYFGVHCPETGAVYLIPISKLDTKHTATLRSIRPAITRGSE
jgi:hypothetical protein